MKAVRIGMFCLAALLSPATGLYASIITETVSGTIGSGIDNAGIFGPQGANLAGDAATVTYMFNPSVLVADGGLYTPVASTSETLSGTVNDGVLTNTITVNGTTFAQTNTPSVTVHFSTSEFGSGTLVDSLIGGLGSEIKIYSGTPYQYPTLLVNPKPFLDLVSATATSITVGIDNSEGQTDFDLTPTPSVTTPEPSSFSLLMVAGLLSAYVVRKTQSTHTRP